MFLFKLTCIIVVLHFASADKTEIKAANGELKTLCRDSDCNECVVPTTEQDALMKLMKSATASCDALCAKGTITKFFYTCTPAKNGQFKCKCVGPGEGGKVVHRLDTTSPPKTVINLPGNKN